jgi:SNF2 family DNA or RNA helicase
MVSEPKTFSKNTFSSFKYNIEVEDNHNYFANGILVKNCTAIKGRKTKTNFACMVLAERASRVYGLSATIIKNDLEEVYSIFSVVVPGLFGNITHFRDTYCQMQLMKIWSGAKKAHIRFPKVVGYKNLSQFRTVLDPYLLIRKKEDVASELPKLISRKIMLEMGAEQRAAYIDALNGIVYEDKVKREFYEISDRLRNGDTSESVLKIYNERKEKYEQYLTADGKKRGKLAALTFCQMVSNGPALLRMPGESSKDIEFERLMVEELQNEKVIVFSRFKSGLPFLEMICERLKIKYVRITGDEGASERNEAKKMFQTDPEYKVIFITTAGSAALNLQAAGVIIFIDTPWSYGDLVQAIGRAQRIGSLQEHIFLIHFVNKGTIDVRVMSKVTGKKNLSDEVLGDTAEGALDFTAKEDSVIDELYTDVLEDAKEQNVTGETKNG